MALEAMATFPLLLVAAMRGPYKYNRALLVSDSGVPLTAWQRKGLDWSVFKDIEIGARFSKLGRVWVKTGKNVAEPIDTKSSEPGKAKKFMTNERIRAAAQPKRSRE